MIPISPNCMIYAMTLHRSKGGLLGWTAGLQHCHQEVIMAVRTCRMIREQELNFSLIKCQLLQGVTIKFIIGYWIGEEGTAEERQSLEQFCH